MMSPTSISFSNLSFIVQRALLDDVEVHRPYARIVPGLLYGHRSFHLHVHGLVCVAYHLFSLDPHNLTELEPAGSRAIAALTLILSIEDDSVSRQYLSSIHVFHSLNSMLSEEALDTRGLDLLFFLPITTDLVDDVSHYNRSVGVCLPELEGHLAPFVPLYRVRRERK